MVNYVNGFSIATDKDKTHLLIRFAQDLPNFDENENNPREIIADVLLERKAALELVQMVKEILTENE